MNKINDSRSESSNAQIDGIVLTPLKIISNDLGNVLHALKNNEQTFKGFGEAYFSFAKKGAIKAWKCHKKMTLNIMVPIGKIKFVLYDNRTGSSTKGKIMDVVLSKDNYQRLTIPPRIWMGFQGLEDENMLLNIADMPHDPAEADKLDADTDKIPYRW